MNRREIPLRRIAVFAPMPSEFRPVVRAFGLGAPGDLPGRARAGVVDGVEVVAATTGMGTALARAVADTVLESGPFDHVLVVGVAGGVTARVGSLVVPAVAVDAATAIEHRAHAFGAEVPAGVVSTSDEFVVDRDALDALAARGVVAVDMETAAIAAVAERLGVPWTAFRVVSDMAAESEEAILGLAHADGRPNVAAALRYMVRRPGRIPYLVQLGRDASAAARAAAAAARRALGEVVNEGEPRC